MYLWQLRIEWVEILIVGLEIVEYLFYLCSGLFLFFVKVKFS